MRFISVQEAAEFTGWSQRQISEAIADGRLAALKQQTGRRKSIKTIFPAHLVRYMAAHMTVKSKEDTEQLSQALEAWIAARDAEKKRPQNKIEVSGNGAAVGITGAGET